MIKFKGTKEDGTPIYGFGLSNKNLKRLKKGEPILINLTEMGEEGEVVIFWGPTEEDMVKKLRSYGCLEDNVDMKVHQDEPIQR